MKIECTCGYLIHDHSDEIRHKAHFIPDGMTPELLDGLDAQVERGTPGGRRAEAAAMTARWLLIGASRRMWQCNHCGTLYLEDRIRGLVRFHPSEPSQAMEILAR